MSDCKFTYLEYRDDEAAADLAQNFILEGREVFVARRESDLSPPTTTVRVRCEDFYDLCGNEVSADRYWEGG